MVMEYAKREVLENCNQNMFSLITDFSLYKPISHDSSSKALFGVLLYIAPEVLYAHGKEYT
ncbi:hypothetical protein C2G38_2188545 [Gigaspora rosea]|uniref:Protein kinase domain-containing protein n=1 Tax=Gigaspora rosea TaxID=44941 RepID=A0A397V6N2_9GLOM|nr:hypothetical protein C2G38_2188545 [Gigaspora rosea]